VFFNVNVHFLGRYLCDCIGHVVVTIVNLIQHSTHIVSGPRSDFGHLGPVAPTKLKFKYHLNPEIIVN